MGIHVFLCRYRAPLLVVAVLAAAAWAMDRSFERLEPWLGYPDS